LLAGALAVTETQINVMNQDESPPTDPDEFLRKQGYKKKLDGETEQVKLLLQKRYTAYMVWRYLVEERKLDVSRNTVLRFTRKIRSEATPDPQTDARVSNGRRIVEAPTNDAIHVSVDVTSSRPRITREVSAASAAHSVEPGQGQEPAGALPPTFKRNEPGRRDVSPTMPDSNAVGGLPTASEASATAVPEDLGGTTGEAATMSTTRVLGSDPMVVHVQVPQSPAKANAAPTPPTFAPSIDRPGPKIDVAPGVQPFTPGNVIRTYSSSTPEARRKIRAFLEAEWGRDVDSSTGGPQSDEHDDFERR
jgi:hypothetical protein